MDRSLVHEGERLDELHRKGYMIIQDPVGFCFGIDAVLLSAFATASKQDKILDIGTGTGIIPILMEARYGGEYTGVEIQEIPADMAKRSVIYNNLEDKIEIRHEDIKESYKTYGNRPFDVITVNPPYMIPGKGLVNPNSTKAISRHELKIEFEDVVRISSHLLKTKGRFYMIHRPSRLVEIMTVMRKYKLEIKRIRMVHPFIDKEANMVLIEAVHEGGAFMKVERPLIVYEKKGQYTKEVMDIYYGE